MDKHRVFQLNCLALELRKSVVSMIGHLGVGHIGGALSICDLLAVLYGEVMHYDPTNPTMPERDMLVCSKGHAGPSVYAALALSGFFDAKELETLNQPGTNLPSHCDMNKTPGIDMTTGSLGQGASSAMGLAAGNRLKGLSNYTYLIMGDGEQNEGQVWEAALFASQQKLSHLIAFVDYNKLQLDGPTSMICDLGNLAAKYQQFGWYAQSIDGHDVEAIFNAIVAAKQQHTQPSVIVLNTIKGKGIGIAENQLGSHNMKISKEETAVALAELDAQLNMLTQGG